MGCNCKITELILAIIIIVFVWWQTTWSGWIITIAAALLIIHAVSCKGICGGAPELALTKGKASASKSMKSMPKKKVK